MGKIDNDERRKYHGQITFLLRLLGTGDIENLVDQDDAIRFEEIKNDHEWDGLSCGCGGGWLVGHNAGCPELSEGKISDWMPITDPIQLAVIGKLGEEVCELGARLFRTVIQGLDGKDPDSERTNRAEISREIADVIACLQTVQRELDIGYDDARVTGKRNGYQRWLGMIRAILGKADGP